MSDATDVADDGTGLVYGDRISCFVGSMRIGVGAMIGRDAAGNPIPLRFPMWAVDSHAVVERIYFRGPALNDYEVACRPTMRDGEGYQDDPERAESPDDDLIIVLINSNGGLEPDISEVAMTRAQYELIDEDLAGWEDAQRGDDDDEDDEPEPGPS